MTAEAVTLKGAPAFAEAGLDIETLLTLISELTRILTVFGPLLAELFPDVGSVT
jgi:hypothetical protein